MAENYENEKYAYLNRLSTGQLEELLRADIESSGESDKGAVFYILEVIEEREKEHPTGRLPEEDKAWEDFQKYYNIPGSKGNSLYPTGHEVVGTCVEKIQAPKVIRLRPILKVAGIAAAVVVGIFGIMIGAQASGIDVFGAIGRWTEKTFHFVTTTSGTAQGCTNMSKIATDSKPYASFHAALNDSGITENLVPTWCPEGLVGSEPKNFKTDFNDSVLCNFIGPNDTFFKIQVRRYHSASDIGSFTFEKDDSTVSQYSTGEKTFYILSNTDTTTATWSDGDSLVWNIVGNIPADDIKAIIDSIGG